jgi:uncharacterized protein involved in cysteine biosynthesis
MRSVITFKVVAAVVTIIGLVLGFFERRFAPKALVTEDSPNYPDWLAWIGWIMAALGALVYIAIDFFSKS